MQTIFIDYLDDGCTGKSNTDSSKCELPKAGMFHNSIRKKSLLLYTVNNFRGPNCCISVFNPQMFVSLCRLKELAQLSL